MFHDEVIEWFCLHFLGEIEIAGNIQWGVALKMHDLSAPVKLKLCGLLDPPEHHGRDWCLLALRLGLCQEKIAALDSQHSSHTMRLLTTADCSIGMFCNVLNMFSIYFSSCFLCIQLVCLFNIIYVFYEYNCNVPWFYFKFNYLVFDFFRCFNNQSSWIRSTWRSRRGSSICTNLQSFKTC